MDTELIKIFISVVTILITAFVTWQIAGKRIAIENITQERAKWREKVRAKAALVYDAMIKRNEKYLNRYRSEFRLLLNPTDCEDMAIIDCLELPRHGDELERTEEFAGRIAILLKNDWELAKHEARPFSFFRRKPKQLTYLQQKHS